MLTSNNLIEWLQSEIVADDKNVVPVGKKIPNTDKDMTESISIGIPSIIPVAVNTVIQQVQISWLSEKIYFITDRLYYTLRYAKYHYFY